MEMRFGTRLTGGEEGKEMLLGMGVVVIRERPRGLASSAEGLGLYVEFGTMHALTKQTWAGPRFRISGANAGEDRVDDEAGIEEPGGVIGGFHAGLVLQVRFGDPTD